MDNDKQKILELLKQHKISVMEASKLLNDFNDANKMNEEKTAFQDDEVIKAVQEATRSLENDMAQISEELVKKLGGMDEHIYNSISLDTEKLSEALKSLQQQLEKRIGSIIEDIDINTQSIVEKLPEKINDLKDSESTLYNGIEKIKDDFSGSPIDLSGFVSKFSGIFGKIQPTFNSMNDFPVSFSKSADDASVIDMNLECINGGILIEKYDGDNVEVSLHCKTVQNDINKALSIIEESNYIKVNVINPDNIVLFYSIKVPKKQLGRIFISASDSRINIDGLMCKSLVCSIIDSKLFQSSSECEAVEISALNGKVELTDMISCKLLVCGSSTPVIADNITAESLDICTTSEKISLTFSENMRGKSEVKLSQDEGIIDIEILQLSKSTGISIDASASKGCIELGDIPGFSYSLNVHGRKDFNHITGQTEGFNDAPDSIKFTVKNAKGSIFFK